MNRGDINDDIRRIKGLIRDIPDFPQRGVIFRDITTLLREGRWFKRAVDLLYQECRGLKFDRIVAVEARGFAIAAPLAYKLKKGLILVRKPGKLPYKTRRVTYQLEYGSDALEMHQDEIQPGFKILLVDDVLATGGTCRAVIDLVSGQGGEVVSCLFLIELTFLKGREKLAPCPVFSLIQY